MSQEENNLVRDAFLAKEAGMTYGKWKAMQTHKVVEKKPEPGMSICPECGKAFKKKSPKQIYCEQYCQRKRSTRNHMRRKADGK